MSRNGWIIVVIAAVLIIGSIIALMALTGETGYRNMTGPVAIIQGPVPTNGFLGVSFGSDASGPAKIENVMPGSGAAEAGLLAGDVIVAVGDIKDPDVAAVKRATEKTRPADMLRLRIRRGDEERDVSVRLMGVEEMLELDLAHARPPSATAPATAPSGAD